MMTTICQLTILIITTGIIIEAEGTNCSSKLDCSSCVSERQCGWCDGCIGGDLLGPLSECDLGSQYHYETCSTNDFGETVRGMLAGGGILIGILTTFFGYRLIIQMLACVMLCIGSFLPYFIASKLLYHAINSYTPFLLNATCIGTGVMSVGLYYLSYTGRVSVLVFKSAVLGLGVLAGCLFTALLFSARSSGGCLLAKVSSTDWSGFLCVWTTCAILGLSLGVMCLKGVRIVFIASSSIVGSVIATASIDQIFTVLQSGSSIGLAASLRRSLSPHIGPHKVCQDWELPGYMLYSSAWILMVVGFIIQYTITAKKGRRHLTKEEVRTRLNSEHILDDDIRCLRRIDPVTGDMVVVGDGEYSDEVSLDDDSTFIENTRERLQFRKAAPVVVQVLAAVGLADLSDYQPRQAKVRSANTSFASRVSTDDLVPIPVDDSDDKKSDGQIRKKARRLSQPPSKQLSQTILFPIGSSVLVRYDESDGETHYPATVVGYDAEGTYTVKYETNEISYGVQEEYLKKTDE